MTNREIISSIYALDKLTKEQEEAIKKEPTLKRMPIKVTYGIDRNKKLLANEHKIFLDELQKLNEVYGLKIDDKGMISLADLSVEQREEYSHKLVELQEIDVNVNIHKISIDDFGAYEPTLKELEVLSFMIE